MPKGEQADAERMLAYTAEVHQHLQRWRLLIATSHRPYANTLTIQLAGGQPPFLPQRVIGICDSAAEILELLPNDCADVLLLTELMLCDGSVLPALDRLKQRAFSPVLLMAMERPLQPALVQAVWRAGVHALVCSDDYGDGELARALSAVNQGDRYYGQAFSEFLDLSLRPISDALSRRELEVLPLLAEGLTNRQIATRLQIAEVTARDHVQHILHKLQVSDRAAAAALAVRLGVAR